MRISRTWLVALTLCLVAMAGFGVAHAQDGGDPDHGGELFVENCAVCHGAEGQGRIGANLENFPGINIEAELIQTITNGIDGTVMPAWGESNGGPLSSNDIADIAAYISSAFSGTLPIKPLPTYQPPPIEPLPNVEGDPASGAVVFKANCVMCHGEEGRGRFGATLAKAWSGVEPQVYIRQVVRRGIEGSTMPAWYQQNGGPLSAAQIDDVTAYVLALSPQSINPTPTAPAAGPLDVQTSLVVLAILIVLAVVVLIVYYRRS
ncbi:MAG: c-type cytochrome [Anaerolineales bacterium]